MKVDNSVKKDTWNKRVVSLEQVCARQDALEYWHFIMFVWTRFQNNLCEKKKRHNQH